MFLLKNTKKKLFLTLYVMKVFGAWPYRINTSNFANPGEYLCLTLSNCPVQWEVTVPTIVFVNTHPVHVDSWDQYYEQNVNDLSSNTGGFGIFPPTSPREEK